MDKRCPVYNTAGFIGKRWTILILTELYKGRKKWKRYSEVKGMLPGITPKMLAMRFKELEKEGMITRKLSTKSFPVKSEYSLTSMGEDFVSVIKQMRKWAIRWNVKNSHCESASCAACEI
ncbi:MAG: helix-turn-helix transcriptional regulator [Candidatus Aenigmatarchaeota archaeon]|nr:MAG: helix-turn-helix transcriptional regulator [Candidatus Aenigmarchaeota archaeon]